MPISERTKALLKPYDLSVGVFGVTIPSDNSTTIQEDALGLAVARGSSLYTSNPGTGGRPLPGTSSPAVCWLRL